MTREQALKQREEAIRQSQLSLYASLQQTLNEVSEEMLGDSKWNKDIADRSFKELMDALVDHFGMEPFE